MTIEEKENTENQQETKCETPLEALKAFKETQERRVAHWKEYDEALEHYEKTNLNVEENQNPSDSDNLHSNSTSSPTPHRCGPMHGSHTSTQTGHYHSVALPMTDAIFNKIIALVTSGLLDCSHSSRTIETELRTALQRPDLANLVGQTQNLENEVLRNIVKRDQDKRIAKLEGRDLSQSIDTCNTIIQNKRQQIQESMEEITAEMAEL